MNTSRATLTAFIWTLLGVSAAVAIMISSYFIPLFMGTILALLAFPLHRHLTKRRVGNKTSALLVTFVLIFLVVGPLLLFATLAIKQGLVLVDFISQSKAIASVHLDDLLKEWKALGEILSESGIESQVKGAVQAGLRAGSLVVLALAKNIPLGLLKLLFACLTCYFLLVDGPRFLRWMYARLPLTFDVRQTLTESFHNTAVSTMWASMAAALAQAIVMMIAFYVLGVPAAFLAGGVTFIFAFVPFAGSFPVWLVAIIYLFIQGSPGKSVTMLVFGIFTATLDNIIRPWILKGRNEMHPLISLIAIVGGIQTFGIFGVFLGPILVASFLSLLQIWPEVGRRHGLEFDTGIEAPSKIVKPLDVKRQ